MVSYQIHRHSHQDRSVHQTRTQLSDDFQGPELGLQWTFWKEYAPVADPRKQTLRIDAKGKTPSDARLLLATAEDKNYETQVEVNVGGNTAGLLLYYSEKAYAGVVSGWKELHYLQKRGQKTEIPNTLGKRFLAKIKNQGNSVRIAVERTARNGPRW